MDEIKKDDVRLHKLVAGYVSPLQGKINELRQELGEFKQQLNEFSGRYNRVGKKPKFKINDWIISEMGGYPDVPRRINHRDTHGDLRCDIGNIICFDGNNYKYATKGVITEYLIEKYHKDYPENRFRCLEGWDDKPASEWVDCDIRFMYCEKDDTLWVRSINMFDLLVYKQGMWAEPINTETIIDDIPHAAYEDNKTRLIEIYNKRYPENRFECLEGRIYKCGAKWLNHSEITFEYDDKKDELWVSGINQFVLCVYEKGKWAKAIVLIDELDNEKPEFKINDWIISEYGAYPNIPRKIKKRNSDGGFVCYDENIVNHHNKYHHATEEEIKAHLIEKYHKDYPENRFECLKKWSKNDVSKWFDGKPRFMYQKKSDILWVKDINKLSLCVYEQGKWAEKIGEKSEKFKRITLSNGNAVEIYSYFVVIFPKQKNIHVGATFDIIKELYEAIT